MNREELRRIMQGVSVAVPTPFDKDYRLDLATAQGLDPVVGRSRPGHQHVDDQALLCVGPGSRPV